MSILGQAEPAVPAGYIVLSLLALAGLTVGWRMGLFRKSGVLGPQRVADTQEAWRILVMLLIGTSAWLGTQIAFATYKQLSWTQAGHEGHFQLSDLTPSDYAFLATAPGIVATGIILSCLTFFPPSKRPRLGLEPRKLPKGILCGLAGILLVMPLIVWVGLLTEWFYDAIHFQHPAEHDLLRAMKHSGRPTLQWLLITGAVLIAPLIEELLFRGLFQTLLVWAFTRPSSPSLARLARGRWLAILLTSALFAGIHDKWTIPPIFALSLCLGLSYERTGSLWVPISLHALFNSLETLFYLSGAAQ